MLLNFQEFKPVVNHKRNRACADMIFLHGTGSSGQMWNRQVELLTTLGHRCFVIDLRGHGETPDPYEPADLEVHLEDIQETLDKAGVNYPAVFVGHSLGAIISVSLAQKRPELFSCIFAAGLPAKVLKPVSYAFRLFMNYSFDAIKRSNVHQNWSFRPRTLINTDRHAIEQIVDNFEGLDFIAKPPKVPCTVHLAAGRFDPVAPCRYAIELHKQLDNSTLKVFEMAGHNFMDTHPQSFNQWLLDGLKN